MAKKEDAQGAPIEDAPTDFSALAPATGGGAGGGLALIQHDELADILGDEDLGIDGLEETDSSDYRISSLVWNFGGKLTMENGDPVPKNRFVDTVSETVRTKLRLAPLTVHKSNRYSVFVEGQGTQVKCSSWDRVTGEMEGGGTRPCQGCPDKEWKAKESGSRGRNCSDIHNVVAIDLEDGQPKVVRFQRTSDRPWKDHLNKHFLGKRVVNGKRQHMPLFAFPTVISLKMITGKSGSYAVPELDREEPFSREEILYFAEQARAARQYMDREIRDVAEAAPDGGSSDAVDTTGTVVDSSEFADDDEAPELAGASRF